MIGRTGTIKDTIPLVNVITFSEKKKESKNGFVSTTTKLVKCLVNWIPLRICVRSSNTQPNPDWKFMTIWSLRMGGMCNGHLRTPNAPHYLTHLYMGHRHAKNCRRQSKNRATSPRCVLFEVTTPYYDEYRPKCQFCPQRCCCCCYASTQLALQLHQERAQGVCSNKEAQEYLAKSNGTPTMDLGHMNVVLKWCVCMLLVDLGIGIIIIIVVIFCLPSFESRVFIENW